MRRFSQSWIVILLVALPALFLWRLWALNPADRQVVAYGDFVEQFYPLRRFAAEELKAGRLPLWNPHIYAGTPALADPQWATLYPPAWLSAFLPPWPPFPFEVLQAEIVLHLGLAGLFTYLFARRHLSTPAAFLAAMIYAFGGYLTSYPPLQLAVLETAAWLPLCLLGAEILATEDHRPLTIDDGRWTKNKEAIHHPSSIVYRPSSIINHQSLIFSLFSAAFPLALAFLAGHPQTFLYIAYTTVAYYLARAWGRLSWWQTLVRLGGWLLAVAGLTAGQWLPTLELARLSPRLVLPYHEAAVGFTWQDLAHIVLPGVSGPWSPLYVGAAPLLLAGIALWHRQGRFWLILALVGVLLSLGAQGGLYWLAYHTAPGFNLFRHQERAALLWSFALAMLAGHGLRLMINDWGLEIKRLKTKDSSPQSSITNHQSSIINHQSSVFSLPSILVGALAVALIALWTIRGQPEGSRLALWSSSAMYMAWMLGGAGLSLPRLGRSPWLVALLGLTLLDLFSTSGRGLLQTPPKDGYFAPNPLVWAIQADRDTPFRVSSEGHLPPGGGNGAVIWRLDDVVGNSPLHLKAYDDLVRDVPELVWWRLLGVRYVITERDLQHGALAEVDRVGKVKLYRLAGSLPLVWVVPAIRHVADETAVRQAMADPLFDPLAWAVSADPVVSTWGLPASGAPLTENRLQVNRLAPTHVTMTVDTPRPGVLIHAEAFAPGWMATVNGAPAPVVQVDGLLRGTPIPAGQSTVEWRYQPWTVTLGLALSGLTTLILLAPLLTSHPSPLTRLLRRHP